jgi:hypothetical protein
MLQVANFLVPNQVEEANKFLATHKPFGEIHFVQDQMLVFYEDGTTPPEYVIADLQDLIRSVDGAMFQQEVALNTLDYERADVNMVKNKGKYEELSSGIQSCKKAIDMQQSKKAFLLKKIEELRAQK